MITIMKNILMMILGVGLALGAAAQPKLANGGRLAGGGTPAKVIVVRPHYSYHPYGYGYYNPFYSPFYGYNAFYYSPYGFQSMPSKLDLEIEQVNNDYHHEIAEVRHDNTLSKADKKQKIRD